MKTYILVLMVTILSGCATLNPLSAFSEKPSLEVNAQVAKNAEQEKSTIKVENEGTKQTADKISNDTKYSAESIQQITNQMPMWMFGIVILMAGWAIPTPKECANGLVSVITIPFRGLANFILLLFGRPVLPGDTQ